MKGLIHIYEGNGKGKTTAAVGLAVRCAGSGNKVLFTQFLKGNSSGELAAMKYIPNLYVLENDREFGFTFSMNKEQKQEAFDYFADHFQKTVEMAEELDVRLLVMDELLDACNAKMVKLDDIMEFLEHKPEEMEVVVTGRNPAEELTDIADYDSYVWKMKHPYDRGLCARKGIEM